MTDSPPASPPQDRRPEDRFVGSLLNLTQRDDGDARRRLAELRRAGAATNGQPRALSIVGHLIPDDAGADALQAYLLTAELIALCAAGGREIVAFDPDVPASTRSLGASALTVNPRRPDADGALADENKGLTARFGAVLALPAEDLPDELRRLVRLLHQKNAPFDFFRLLTDLLHWKDPDEPVQKTWARHYWSASTSTVS